MSTEDDNFWGSEGEEGYVPTWKREGHVPAKAPRRPLVDDESKEMLSVAGPACGTIALFVVGGIILTAVGVAAPPLGIAIIGYFVVKAMVKSYYSNRTYQERACTKCGYLHKWSKCPKCGSPG